MYIVQQARASKARDPHVQVREHARKLQQHISERNRHTTRHRGCRLLL